ncbi:MAG: aminotransferase class IV [Phycisphaeraceae bacterium]
MKVYLDGQFIDAEDAKLSIFDAAVQHGVGLFETMHAYHGRVFQLDAHIARLVHSAGELGLTHRLKEKPLREAVEMTLTKNKLTEGRQRLRLTVTGGDLAMLSAARAGKGAEAQQPTICITPSEATVYPEGFFTEGVTVVIADPKANPFDPTAGHKTINYWVRLRSLMQAAQAGAAEALWFSVTNHLAGGAVSNALLVKDEQLYTPIARGEEVSGSLPSAVLPGVTRAAVLELAEELDLPVHRKMLTINDVLEADELMLTNTSWGILPVVRVEKETIGDGRLGKTTQQLYEALLKKIGRECAADDAEPA